MAALPPKPKLETDVEENEGDLDDESISESSFHTGGGDETTSQEEFQMETQANAWTVEEYVTARGENLVLAFLSMQSGRGKTEAIALLKLLRERGNLLGMPHSRPLGEGLFELRGTQVRIFYMFRPGRRITLLDGMIKKQERIPARVLGRLRRFQREVEAIQG